ncbi:MAG: DUF3570 domain-containing protein [Adhaeribacter sp.]
MRKIYLSVALAFASIVSAFAQRPVPDSSGFKPRKLKIEEVNFVTSYYTQDGNNSAVTGGIGTESLTDFANTFDIFLSRTDRRQRVHRIGVEIGIDNYTSASSDKIDPTTISSASAADTRIYPSVSWSRTDDRKRYLLGATASLSTEYDYFSKGAGLNFSKFSNDNNREFGLKVNAFLDTWKVIYPIELRHLPGSGGSKPRNSYSSSFSLSQIINPRLQLSILADLTYQTGELGTLYQRVYFLDNSEQVEHLPETRFKIPLGLRANYFAGDKLVIRSFYRYYQDDWGISAHTFEIETPYKITPFLSLSPFYRFYTQTQADYFAGYQAHSAQETFFTSDYDLSAFSSNYEGLNIRLNAVNGVFGIHKLNTLEVRYGHYNRSTSLVSNSITLAAKLK